METTPFITMVELFIPDHEPSVGPAEAERAFESLGLPATRTIVAPYNNGEEKRMRHFSVMTMPRAHNDCLFITRKGSNWTGVLHGSDCNMVRRIHADMISGTQSPFEWCERREAGGSFRLLELPADKSEPADRKPTKSARKRTKSARKRNRKR